LDIYNIDRPRPSQDDRTPDRFGAREDVLMHTHTVRLYLYTTDFYEK